MIYDGQVIANSVAYAALGNWLVKKIKESELIPWFNKQTYWMNKVLAIVIAAVGAIGVTYTYSYSDDGVLSLTLAGLTLANIWISFKTFVISYALQQTGYHITKPVEDYKK